MFKIILSENVVLDELSVYYDNFKRTRNITKLFVILYLLAFFYGGEPGGVGFYPLGSIIVF